MNKKVLILLAISTFLFMLVLSSCTTERGEDNMYSALSDNHYADDSITLVDALTKEYSLEELNRFFSGNNVNEAIGFGAEKEALSFHAVNQMYPVEVVRSTGYSVYKVSQGGYFYVFWAKPFSPNNPSQEYEPTVYFSAYLPSMLLHLDDFRHLIVGKSTAEDVRKIDPSFELSFLLSSGVKSYSLLDDKTIMEISYTYDGTITGYDDLVVTSMEPVARNDVPARYSSILARDYP